MGLGSRGQQAVEGGSKRIAQGWKWVMEQGAEVTGWGFSSYSLPSLSKAGTVMITWHVWETEPRSPG